LDGRPANLEGHAPSWPRLALVVGRLSTKTLRPRPRRVVARSEASAASPPATTTWH